MLTDQIFAAVTSAVSIIIGAVLTFSINWFNKKFEERRQLRQIAIEAAVTNWKQAFEAAKISGELTKTTQRILPLDVYIVHMIKLFDILSKEDVSASNVEEKLRSVRYFSGEAAKAAENDDIHCH